MRIISGKYRGRKLQCGQDLAIRPTSDKTRESIFNILSSRYHDFADQSVLDLYAGTGALGLEALSRGAGKITFVENAPQALAVLKKNISLVAAPEACEIISSPVNTALTVLSERGELFALIFMDPPYGKNLVHKTLEELSATPLAAKDALIVCEHFARDAVESNYGPLHLVDERCYGQTRISFFG